jgi:hypothetical protein
MSSTTPLTVRRYSVNNLTQANLNHHAILAVFLCYIFGTVIFTVSTLASHFRNRNVWKGMQISGDHEFWCERDHPDQFIREPMNSWSDFGFLFVGITMLYFAISDTFFSDTPRNLCMDHPVLSFVSAIVNIFHAVGTFTNHACRCWTGYQMDVTGMYLVIMFPILVNFLNIHRNSIKGTSPTQTSNKAVLVGLLLYAALGVCLFLTTYVVEDPGHLVVPLLVIMVISFLVRFRQEANHRDTRHFTLLSIAAALLIFGYASWLLDRHRIVCFPDSAFQLHAVWHVATAGALFALYVYHRSEGYSSLKNAFFPGKSLNLHVS